MPQEPGAVPQIDPSAAVPARIRRTSRVHWGLTVCLFVVFSLGGVGALVAWYWLWPSYTAECLVEVEPCQDQALSAMGMAKPGGAVGSTCFPQVFPEAHARIIKRYTVLEAALKKLGSRQTTYRGPDAAYALGRDLAISCIPRTHNISVSLTGRNPKELAAIVTAVLEEFIATIEDDRKQADAQRQADLRVERDALRAQLEDLSRQINRLRTDTSAIDLNEQGGELSVRLAALTQQLVAAQAALAEAEADWKQFEQAHKESQEGADLAIPLALYAEVKDALSKDPSLAAMKEQVWRLNMELAGLKTRPEEKKDDILRVEAMLKSVKGDLESARAEALSELLNQRAGILKAKYDRAREVEAQILAKVTEARETAYAIAVKTAEYRERDQEYRRIQGLLDTVMNGLERLRIAAALSRSNVRVIQWPMPPFEPSEPRLGRYIPAVVALSALFAIGLGLLVPRIVRHGPPGGGGATA